MVRENLWFSLKLIGFKFRFSGFWNLTGHCLLFYVLKCVFLLQCKCEDEYCLETIRRMEVCRPQVMKGAANATSSCRLSQLICLADAQCSTALGYYNDLCRSMYRRGRKCSNKCMNSIDILRKQEKAAALVACRCDGNEDYDCPRMQRNLQRLCFHKKKSHGKGEKEERERDKDKNKERLHKKVHKDVETGTACVVFVSWVSVLISIFSASLNTWLGTRSTSLFRLL